MYGMRDSDHISSTSNILLITLSSSSTFCLWVHFAVPLSWVQSLFFNTSISDIVRFAKRILLFSLYIIENFENFHLSLNLYKHISIFVSINFESTWSKTGFGYLQEGFLRLSVMLPLTYVPFQARHVQFMIYSNNCMVFDSDPLLITPFQLHRSTSRLQLQDNL